MRALAHTILLSLLALCSASASAMEAGFQLESFTDAQRSRPILIDWWYPVAGAAASPFNYGLGSGRVVEAGAIAEGAFPLILMSHGALGAARNYSWIAEALARSGYIVAGVSHFGESYVYGADTVDPVAVLRHWERPADFSAALDHILSSSNLRQSINPKRIGFLGHSSGGATALQLAGALLDTRRMSAYCASELSDGDRGCEYAKAAGAGDLAEAPPPDRSYRDPRMRAIAALDPALGPAFNDFASIPASVDLLLIASVDNDFLPFAHYAARISQHLPQARTHWLDGGEGHFVYLNQCALDVEANGVALCRDREGVDRGTVQQELKRQILAFFGETL